MVGRTFGDVGKAKKTITSQTIKNAQQDIMGARNINVQMVKIKSYILKLLVVKIIS
jgi:hypothetical protein